MMCLSCASTGGVCVMTWSHSVLDTVASDDVGSVWYFHSVWSGFDSSNVGIMLESAGV